MIEGITEKINKNYSLWYRYDKEEEKHYKWNDYLLSIQDHKHNTECFVDILDIKGVKILVFEYETSDAVYKACKEKLKELGYTWRKVMIFDRISSAIMDAEKRIDILQNKMSHHPEKIGLLDVKTIQADYNILSNSHEWEVAKTYDELHPEQYENYFNHTMQELQEKGMIKA